jgi:hypothetical protein
VTGFLTGVIAAGIFGFLLQLARLSWRSFRAGYRPQMAQVATRQTPAQAMWRSTWGCLTFLVYILLAAMVLGGAYLYYWANFG